MIIQTKLLTIMLILFLASALTFGSASRYGVFVSAAEKNNMRCDYSPGGNAGVTSHTCCWEEEGSDGVTRTWCVHCTNTNHFEFTETTCSDPVSFAVTKGPSLPSPPTNVLPPGNTNTSTFPLGNMIKVPPGTTNALPSGNTTGNATNTTGTLPAQTITKEHNPASPNVFSLAPNATNAVNNTSTLKLSPLTGQHIQTSSHHHHKGGSTSSSSNTNSTGH